LQKQQKEILEKINGSNFIQEYFPLHGELTQKLAELKKTKDDEERKQERFAQWRNQGQILEGEFRELS
jgi:hypothetical protein